MVEPIVEAIHLKKRFGNLVAVDDVSFEVFPGECFGILGPNGAGKTSTIRMIYGFSPMTDGSLKVFGLDISQNMRAGKARIGVCQQENNLDPDLTVLQNLEVFARYFDIPLREAHERARSLLQFMALDHRRETKAIELSGGMMRRLVLARALINNPELLILDEPTTGLDPQSRHQVWESLEQLRADGLTILLTTHYMDEASRLCDRLLIMDGGHILVQGKPSDLIQEYIGHGIIEVNEPTPTLRSYLQTLNLQYEDTGHRLIIYSEGSGSLYQEIRNNYCKGGCLMRMATLEDVFLKLTGRELKE
ncbi:MAG: ABC transporter [Syntrophaceae bacterium CG2_30_49_12]|nr:MAG: ABC transporter [Syntrophaceae bacterium CG2_30_49_12]PIP06747.1 MAG: ABC transporter [Syntrophobacterales bacterium CG23_combo_of_CG06-09_8_20_14_all_48_27]PJC74010.1 MAG: ABC transporter [Syntrophobacterales bacterium CG_4_8_14_3_um_filter_49_14]